MLLLAAPAVDTLVVPFDNLSPEGTHGWVAEALAEALTFHLRHSGRPVLDRAARQRLLRARGDKAGAPLPLGELIALGKDVGARRAVRGRFRVLSDPTQGAGGGRRLEVTAEVIDLVRETKLGVIEDHGAFDNLLVIANHLAKNLLRLEGEPLAQNFDVVSERRRTVPLEAYELYVRALMSASAERRRSRLERALELLPTYAEAKLLLGRLQLDGGDVAQAIETLSSIDPEAPSYRDAYFYLGLAYLAAFQNRLAAEVFGRLSEQEGAAPFLSNLGVALVRAGETEKALGFFRRAVDRRPSVPTYHFNLGWGAWKAGRLYEAREALLETTRLDAEDAEAHLLLAVLASEAGDTDAAEREWARVVALSPDLVERDVLDPNQGPGASLSGQLDGMARIVREAPPRVPRDPASVPAAGHQLYPGAEGVIEKARERREAGRLEQAASALQQAIYRDPHVIETRLELAEVFRELGELDKAAGQLRIALWDREDVAIHLRLASLYEEMGERERALFHAERALEIDGDDPEARRLVEELTGGSS